MFEIQSHRIVALNTFPLNFSAPIGERPASSLVAEWERDSEFQSQDYDRHAPKLANIGVPESLRSALANSKGEMRLFEMKELPERRDHYPPVSSLMTGRLLDRCKVYQITPSARDLFNGEKLPKSTNANGVETQCCFQLGLALRSAAIERLSRVDGLSRLQAFVQTDAGGKANEKLILPLKIHDLILYHFATNRVVCSFQLELDLEEGTIASALLTEAVDHCGRFADLAWVKEEKFLEPGNFQTRYETIMPNGFTVGALISSLVTGSKGVSEYTSRTFTHTYAQIAPASPEATNVGYKALGAVLARQYNSDYAFSDQAKGVEFVTDFDNVVHVVAREGAATIVDPLTNGVVVPALKNFIGSFTQSYLPLSVLNLHQLARSLEISAKSHLDVEITDTLPSSSADAERQTKEIVTRWSQLQRDMSSLVTRYRFRQVSSISMHNRFHDAMRRVLSLDVLESQLSGDLQEISSEVQAALAIEAEARRARFEKAYYFVPYWITGFAAALVVIQLATGFLDFATSGYPGLLWLVLALVVGSAAAGMVWAHLRGREASAHD